MSRSKTFQEKKHFKSREKTFAKHHYRILIGLLIFSIVYHWIFDKFTIGSDFRYSLYVFWIPTVTGLVIFAFYRRGFLMTQFSVNRGIILWGFMIVFYIAQGILFSYLSFGQVAKIAWNIANDRAAAKANTRIIHCPITRFWIGRKCTVDIEFNGRSERLPTSFSFIHQYEDADPENYDAVVTVRRGLWDHYVIDDLVIEKRPVMAPNKSD